MNLLAYLYKNMTSSTKPEVHNVLDCSQRMTEPRSQVTSTENLVKFGHVVLEICERRDRQTNKQTDTLIAILCWPTGVEIKILRTYAFKRLLAESPKKNCSLACVKRLIYQVDMNGSALRRPHLVICLFNQTFCV